MRSRVQGNRIQGSRCPGRRGRGFRNRPLRGARRARRPLRCRRRFARRRRAGLADLGELAGEEPREPGRVGVVEDDGVGGDVFPRERPVEPVPELDGHQRVHAEVEEPRRRGGRGGQPEHRLELLAHEGRQHVLPIPERGFPEPGQEVVRRSLGHGARIVFHRRGKEVLEEGRARREALRVGRPVHRGHRGGGRVLREELIEGPQALLRGQPPDPAGREVLLDPFALLLRLADPRPRPPGDGLPRESPGATVGGELVQERVGGGVVRLARRAENPHHAREQDEEVEVAFLGRPVELPGAEHLRPEHRLEPLPALVRERAVRQHPDAVDDPRERRQVRVDPREHRVHRGGVGDVGDLHPHRHSALLERSDRLARGCIRSPPTVEHDRARSPVREQSGHRAADPAHAAGHEVGPVLAQPAPRERRHREDDLSDVPGRAHVRHRRSRFGHRPAGVGKRRQLPRREPFRHAPEGRSGAGGIGTLEHVQAHDGVVHVRACRRHRLLAPDVPCAELDEPAAAREALEARLDESGAGQAVQHHVDPRPVRRREDFFAERRPPAVEDVGDPERPEIRPFRRARGREHLRAGRARELDGGKPHPSRPGVDEHPFAGLEPDSIECERRGREDHRDGGEGGRRDPRRRGRHELRPGHHLRSEGAEREPHHPFAGRHLRDVRAGLDDPPAELAAEEARIEGARRAQHVAEVEAGRLDRDPNLARFEGFRRDGLRPHPVEGAARVGSEPPSPLVGEGDPRRAGADPDEARDVAPSRPVRDVVLAVGVQQLVGEGGGRHVRSRVEIDHPGAEVRRFAGRRLAKAPERRPGDLAGRLALEHLGAAGDERQALRGGRARIHRALDEGEGGGPRPLRVLRHLRGRRARPVARRAPRGARRPGAGRPSAARRRAPATTPGDRCERRPGRPPALRPAFQTGSPRPARPRRRARRSGSGTRGPPRGPRRSRRGRGRGSRPRAAGRCPPDRAR